MKRLGKGLADLIDLPQDAAASAGLVVVKTAQIRPGRFQPRTSVSDTSLEELKASIRQSGIIEPVVVRPGSQGTYELVAGERRFRAAQALGLIEIPAVVKTLSDQQAAELSLIENVQRENLNPLEEARGYSRLTEAFGYTQESLAMAVGKDRATIANLLRILRLPEEIRQGLLDEKISLGHAKVLLTIEDRGRQTALYQKILANGLSVRHLEGLATNWMPSRKRRVKPGDPNTAGLEEALRRALGTKVSVKARKKGGRIVIEYFSSEELTRLLGLLSVSVG
ncbi:MAG: ParB/RepB/Spo0J family partition protein [Candidatus Omnitrophica bacterium]|nr:ParB/RepB/Spo0J family partition protein [Candidatus Omnitrophota bacterium]